MSKSVELDKIIDAVTYEIGYPGHGSITLGDWAEAFVKALSIQQEADAKDAAMFRKLEKIMGRGEYMPGRDVHRAIEVLVDPNPSKPMPADCGFKIIRHYKWRIQGTSPDIRECLGATPTDSEDK